MKDKEFDLIIEPGRVERQYWTDLWRYRDLFYFLAWRDILVRYKQTVIGIAWSVLRPLFTMLAFTLVFNKVAKLDSGSTPYPILIFAALLPWQLFSNALSETSGSLISNSNLISKVYFPRIIIPVSSIIVCLIDFLLAAVIMMMAMIYYSSFPNINALYLPLYLILTLIVSTGMGLWLAALNVNYRDFRFVVPFIIQFGLYISPVGFSSSVIPENWRTLYSLNPLVGIIDGFRWCLIDDSTPLHLPSLVISISIGFFLLISGIMYFRYTEKSFADKI